MGEAPVGGTASGIEDPGCGGGGSSTGSGGAPATGVPSAPPAAGGFSPEEIRTILSGVWMPSDTASASAEASMSPVSPVEGALQLDSTDRVLPDLLAGAAVAGAPLSLVLARPGGPAGAAATPIAPGAVADLAAALSVSVASDEHLVQAGSGHLGVVVPGGPGKARRRAERLMQRAAVAGAPTLTWALASAPRDGLTSTSLVDKAMARLQMPDRGQSGSAILRSGRAAVWAGVAAAVVAGALAFTFGSGASPSAAVRHLASGKQPDLQASGGTGSVGGSGGSGGNGGGTGSGSSSPSASVQTSVPSSWVGGGQGTGGSTTDGSPGGTSTDNTNGAGGSDQGSQGQGSQGQGGGSSSTGTGSQGTGTSSTGTTDTTVPGSVTTTIPVTTTTTTTTTGSGSSSSKGKSSSSGSQCGGLLQGLLCTVGGLLK